MTVVSSLRLARVSAFFFQFPHQLGLAGDDDLVAAALQFDDEDVNGLADKLAEVLTKRKSTKEAGINALRPNLHEATLDNFHNLPADGSLVVKGFSDSLPSLALGQLAG